MLGAGINNRGINLHIKKHIQVLYLSHTRVQETQEVSGRRLDIYARIYTLQHFSPPPTTCFKNTQTAVLH